MDPPSKDDSKLKVSATDVKDVETSISSNEKLDEEKQAIEPRRPWFEHPRIVELYKVADWWTLWIGLLSFFVAVALVFALPLDAQDGKRVKYVVPQPESWESNPFDAWNAYNLVGVPLLFLVFLTFYLASLKCMGKLVQKQENQETGETTVLPHGFLSTYIKGFLAMAFIATIAFWFGRNEWCSENGLGYAVFAILFGMIPTNTPGLKQRTAWLQNAAKDGEFFIKCSLVLLAVELTVLAKVGKPAMIVTWIGSPLAIIAGFVVGTRLFKCENALAMLVAVGASWCGASAISAVAPVVMASSQDVTLSISVVAFFTVIFTFVQPYIAIAVGMPDKVAGAWIGGSVDQTGNVLVSAAIVSDEATEVAGITKMVLNAGLGVMASVIACYWSAFEKSEGDEEGGSKFSLIMLWDKFPKFTLGFIITSVILTIMVENHEGTLEAEALPRAVSTLNKWWFAIAFVGIGLTTDVKKLFKEVSGVCVMRASKLEEFSSLTLPCICCNVERRPGKVELSRCISLPTLSILYLLWDWPTWSTK